MKQLNCFLLVVLMTACAVSSYAQKKGAEMPEQHLESQYLKLNRDVMQAYHELDSVFPLRYLANESPTHCAYWVNYTFASKDEFEKYKPWVESILARLQTLDVYSRTVGVADSAGVYKRVLSAQLVTPNAVQKDKLIMSLSNTKVGFYYISAVDEEGFYSTGSLDDPNGQPRQDIADAMDRLLKSYVNRKNVRKDSVRYDDNENYRYASFVAKRKGITSGVRYVVPGCDESDYAKFRNAIRSYSMVAPVRTACNDMYWQYDASAIAIARPGNRQPIMVAAELKGSNLYLLRVEGHDGMSFLPRAWAEEDAAWKWKDLYEVLGRKPLDPPAVK